MKDPIPIDLKKSSNILSKEVVKSTKFNTLKTNINNLENQIPDAATIFHKIVLLRINFLMPLV